LFLQYYWLQERYLQQQISSRAIHLRMAMALPSHLSSLRHAALKAAAGAVEHAAEHVELPDAAAEGN